MSKALEPRFKAPKAVPGWSGLDDIEIGPCMRALNPRHREAVRQLFETRGDRTAAFVNCGYGGDRRNPRWRHNVQIESSKFFADKRVRLAIAEECRARLDAYEPEVLETVRSIALSPKAKASDRLRALDMLWTRSRPVETKHHIEVEHSITNDERDMQHFLAMKRIGAPEDAFIRRFGTNGIARVEALVAAEEARRRQLDGEPAGAIIDARAEETSDAAR
jgi:hypothetical protein